MRAAFATIKSPAHRGSVIAGIAIALVAVLCWIAAPPANADDAPAERLAVPKSAAQTPIANSLRTAHREDYASHDAGVHLSLAREFQKQAGEAGVDPVRQYVLLREARELATNAGNFDAAFSIIDDTARLFVVDPNELKVTVLSNSMDRSLISKPELFDNYLKAGQAALARGNVQLANQTMVLAREITRAAHDAGLTQRERDFELRVHSARREYDAIVAAANKLRAHPDDAEANLLVGRYVCFVQGQWDAGLPVLAQCSDPRLKAIAEKDLEGPNDAEAMANLGDAYWDLPDSPKTPRYASRKRAAHWYEQAAARLKEPRKSQVQQRIDAQSHEPK
jgi:hypothetical protein